MNANKVLVSVACPEYIHYYLPMIQSSIEKGEWDGDFCLIVNEDINIDILNKLTSKGVYIFKVNLLPKSPLIHHYKIYLFDDYFKKWEWVLYSDIDVLFLNPIKLNLKQKKKDFLYTKKDDLPFMEHFLENNLSNKQIKEKDKIYIKHGNGDAFQTCYMLYHSDIINLGYFKKLYNAYLHYYCLYSLTRHPSWDQSIFNVVFFKKWLDIGKGFLNRNPVMDQINWDYSRLQDGYMDTNNYSNTIALHFGNHFTPWNKNNLRFYPIWEKYNTTY